LKKGESGEKDRKREKDKKGKAKTTWGKAREGAKEKERKEKEKREKRGVKSNPAGKKMILREKIEEGEGKEDKNKGTVNNFLLRKLAADKQET